MAIINVTNTKGETRKIEAEVGLSLMENLRNNDVDDLAALCGGCVSCCTCHVHVEGDWASKLPAKQDDEQLLLEDSDFYEADKSRLSCQVEMTDEMDGIQLTVQAEA